MEWLLESKIVNTDMCAKCSVCAIVCPNNIVDFKDRPYLKEECLRKGHGMCFETCPRVSSGKYQIKIRENFKEEYYYGKGDIEGQDGGVVSSFLKYLIENNKIDGAIVVGKNEYWKPVSMIVQTSEDIIKGTKSKYTVSTLEALKEAGKLGLKKVAVVGLPCQINGLRKLKYFAYLNKHDYELGKDGKPVKLPKIEYLIGLFCMEKFEYESLKKVLEDRGINIKDVKKFDIKRGKFLVYLEDRVEEFKIEEFEVCKGCLICRDFTAELADVSVGSVGSPDGYSTVIIRTKKGEEIKKAIELYEGVNIEKIKKLEEKKLKRFKKEVERRKNNNLPISFYWAADYPGVKKRPDGTFFIRLRAKPSGFYTYEDIENVLKIAKKYNLKIELTNRDSFELHKANGYDIEDIINELKSVGLSTGSEGPLVRSVLACPGANNCTNGNIDTTELAKILNEKFKEKPTPNKLKIAISGCPSGCVRPDIHDIGIVGVRYPTVLEDKCNGCGRCFEVCKPECIYIRGSVSYTNYNLCVGCGKCIDNCPNEARIIKENGYMVYIGGKSGRGSIIGVNTKVKDLDELIKIIDGVIYLYNKYSQKPQRERLAHVMKRVGYKNFLDELKELIKEQ